MTVNVGIKLPLGNIGTGAPEESHVRTDDINEVIHFCCPNVGKKMIWINIKCILIHKCMIPGIISTMYFLHIKKVYSNTFLNIKTIYFRCA